jgi:hypothetical protein
MATGADRHARGYRRSGSPLGARLRDDSRVTKPDPSPSTTTSTSDQVVPVQAIALVPSEAIALSTATPGSKRSRSKHGSPHG